VPFELLGNDLRSLGTKLGLNHAVDIWFSSAS
jgi:hypothetical protein